MLEIKSGPSSPRADVEEFDFQPTSDVSNSALAPNTIRTDSILSQLVFAKEPRKLLEYFTTSRAAI